MPNYDTNPSIRRQQIDQDLEVVNSQLEFLESLLPTLDLLKKVVEAQTSAVDISLNLKKFINNLAATPGNTAAFEGAFGDQSAYAIWSFQYRDLVEQRQHLISLRPTDQDIERFDFELLQQQTVNGLSTELIEKTSILENLFQGIVNARNVLQQQVSEGWLDQNFFLDLVFLYEQSSEILTSLREARFDYEHIANDADQTFEDRVAALTSWEQDNAAAISNFFSNYDQGIYRPREFEPDTFGDPILGIVFAQQTLDHLQDSNVWSTAIQFIFDITGVEDRLGINVGGQGGAGSPFRDDTSLSESDFVQNQEFGTDGQDLISGSQEADHLYGGLSADNISGNDGDDVV